MIMVGRSLVCGSSGGAPSPVPGPRAGGLPERRHERAGAARRVRGDPGVAARAGGARPQRQGVVRAPGRAHRRAARTRGRRCSARATSDVAITGSTTDGINAVLHAVDLQPGDEILTSDEEHPGVLGPLATARDTRGVSVRVVPFGDVPDEVRPDTRLVVTSHVSWATGRVMNTDPLAASHALLVLDGAQGLGAVPSDVTALGCDFYAASGQKWLCGPGGIGYLYANPELVHDLPAPWSGYHALEDARARARAGASAGRPPPHHGLPGAAPRGVGACVARRARGGGTRGGLRARLHGAEPPRAAAERAAA